MFVAVRRGVFPVAHRVAFGLQDVAQVPRGVADSRLAVAAEFEQAGFQMQAQGQARRCRETLRQPLSGA